VGRKWAEAQSFQGLVAKPANNTLASIQGKTPDTAVGVEASDFDAGA
jgi:hypothetical protein